MFLGSVSLPLRRLYFSSIPSLLAHAHPDSLKNTLFVAPQGLASAAAIAQVGGTVVMACRSLDKCRAASKEVMRTAANGGRAITMQLDLASFTSIDSFAKDFIDGELRLDYLMANAGFASAPHNGATTTAEGFELGLGAMHFGHFRLFKHLQHLMVDTAGGLTLPGKNIRVVVTSSAASQFAGSMGDFDASLFEGDGQGDLKGEKLQVTSPAMYVRAKLANVLFARELQRRMADVPGMAGFTACSCHVGAVATSIWKMPYLWLQYPVDLYTRLAMRTLEQGRRTMLKCLLSEDKDVVGRGAYIDGMGFALDDKDMAPPSNNDTLARRLWDVSESVAGVL